MPPIPFRFLHASDFHLERPPSGMAEVPDHLLPRLVDSPYRAAERVFDTAVRERVDFVVLAGDLLDPTAAGPAALVFLMEQFERLRALDIAVYWAAGPADQLGDWAGAIALPANVRFFRTAEVARVVHQRGGQAVAEITARGAQVRANLRPAEFRRELAPGPADLAAIAVAHGTLDPHTIAEPAAAANPQTTGPQITIQRAIDYWALGGEHARSTLPTLSKLAHYSGSPQGRCPQEAGPHGCTLVQFDETGAVRTSFVPTDVVRWQREQIPIGATTTLAELERVLAERIASARGDETGPDLLLDFSIAGGGPLAAQLRRGRLASELVSRLRTEHGQKQPAAWTLSVQCAAAPWTTSAAPVPRELYEQQTILGEFLRALGDYGSDPGRPLACEHFLSERQLAGSLAAVVGLQDQEARSRALREAAVLGVDLLGPEEPAL
jgi:DNA repair exonuclease SbcCD nuclease subunit